MIRCRIFSSSSGKTEIKERKPDGGLVFIQHIMVGEGLADGDARFNAILFVNTLPRQNIISICESDTETSYVVTVYYEE